MSSSLPNTSSTSSDLKVEDFTQHPEVLKCLTDLNTTFNATNPLIVSDAIDNDGHQYVNLVQKGGGVLGVALVGYTYILEEMGIRFMRLAGTSAGAINTALMTVIGKKEEAKSTRILKSICDLNFFNLVDGHPAARLIIKNFITHEDFTIKVKKWLLIIFSIPVVLLLADFTFLGLEHHLHWASILTKLFFVLTGFYSLLLTAVIYYSVRLLKRLKDSGYGINPGDYFYDWIKDQLIANGVKTVDDLNAKASQPISGLHLRVDDNPDGINNLRGDVTFITSELVTKNKIQFPEMCCLFRGKDDIKTMQPAGFIRASMSIPVFFESYMINNIPCHTDEIKKAWLDTFNETDPPTTARFVDGGMLSNFPINIFYNPKVLVARLPSFGIDLDDTKSQEDTKPKDSTKPGNDTKDNDEGKHAESWSIGGYFGRMFDTIRFYYDKDFLIKNKVFEKGIGKIPLAKYNWLNFFLKDKDKIDMFVLGAQAATEFLKNFKWDDYKNNRTEMQVELNKQSKTAVTNTELAAS